MLRLLPPAAASVSQWVTVDSASVFRTNGCWQWCDFDRFAQAVRLTARGSIRRPLCSGRRFRRSRLPASWAVADPVVGNRLQQRVDQPPAILWPRRLDLRGERRDGLLGPLEADLPRFGVALGRGDGHDGAEQGCTPAGVHFQISGTHHLRALAPGSTSICIVDLIERISTSPSHLRSYNSPICLPPTDGSRIVVTTLNSSTRLSLPRASTSHMPHQRSS